MKTIKIFLFILLAFFVGNILSVSASEVTGSVTVTVNPTLTVTKLGTGTGTVTSSDGKINCGGTCSASYPLSAVDLIQVASPGSIFAGWGGDPDCSDGVGGVVTMDGNKNCTATFNATGPNYTLTVTKAGTGAGLVTGVSNPVQTNINCGTTCTSEVKLYSSGTTVTLAQSASSGSTFTSWSADCPGGVVNMNADKTCTVTFALNTGFPDLQASTSLPNPNTAIVGLPKTFTSTISNVGTVGTPLSFYNSFQVSTGFNGAAPGSFRDTNATMPILAAGASDVSSATYTFPTIGNYSVRFCADINYFSGNGRIDEGSVANENNNCSSSGWTNVTVVNSASLPVVDTNSITNITKTSATSGGNVTSAGTSAVTSRGVSGSTIPNISGGSGVGNFVSNITGLIANTTYDIEAYATNSSGTGFGGPLRFTTLPSTSITASSCTSTSINLTWPASTGAANYTVVRSGFMGPPVYSGGGLTHTDTGLTSGTIYTYTLNVGGSGGTYGTQTASFTATAGCGGGAPVPNLQASAPTQNTATVNVPQTFTSTISNEGTVGTGASFVNSFQVATGFGGATPGSLITTTPATMSALAAKGSAGSSAVASATHTFSSIGNYSVRFCADNTTAWGSAINEGTQEGDNCSPWTDVPVPPAGVIPTTPTNFNVSAPSCGVWLNLSWDATANASSYVIDKSTDGGITYPTTIIVSAPSTSDTDYNVLTGQAYYYRVLARNASGNSAWSSPKFEFPPAACPSASDKPTVVTDPLTRATTVKNIISGGDVTSQGSDPVSERGVVWSNDNNPGGDPDVYTSLGSYKIIDGAGGLGKFISNIDVTTGSSYNPWSPQRYAHVRAYARNWYGPSHGNTIHIDLQNIPVVPTVDSCTPSSLRIAKNASVNVSWSSTGTTSCKLFAGVNTTVLLGGTGAPSGTKTLSPISNVKYKVVCSKGGVDSAPYICPEIKVGSINPIYQEN